MNTLAEIEEALTKLSADELAHVEITLRRLRDFADEDAAPAPVKETGNGSFQDSAKAQTSADGTRAPGAGDGI